MKIRYNALQSFALMMSLLLVGVSGAWADLKKSQMGNDVCSPKIHFQLPDGWTTAYLMIGGQGVAFPKADADGWSMIDLGATKTNDGATFFINDVNNSACNNSRCVTTSGIITGLNGDANSVGFTCSSIGKDDGMDFWIMAHPDVKKEGAIYTKNSMPVIRDFYVFLPNNTTWKSAEPMLYEVAADGKAVDTKMYNDADNCGWYYRRYIDEDIPKSVLIHRDDDEDRADAIGQNGAWEEMYIPGSTVKVRKTYGLKGGWGKNHQEFIYASTYDNMVYAADLINAKEELKVWFSDDNDVTRMKCRFNFGVKTLFPDAVVLVERV